MLGCRCDVGLSVRCWVVGVMLGCRCDVGLSVRCWVVCAMLGCWCDVSAFDLRRSMCEDGLLVRCFCLRSSKIDVSTFEDR